MSEFYQTGEPCILKKGVNQIKSDNDFKYMPSLLLVGDFSYTITSDKVCRLTLYPRTHVCSCGEYINDYGKVELTEKIHIPMNAIQIELSGTPLFTKLYINDTLLGERAFSPYIFDIPTDMQGKDLDLKIVQYSSIAPIFGDIAHWDKTVTNCGWRGTPSPCQAPFGISKIRLLFNMLPLEFSPNL